MGKYKKIYVLAPFGHSTGGVELAHQLVDYLRNKNLEAYIVYVAKGDKVISNDQSITANYSKYNLRSTDVIEDSSDNILVLPEIYFEFILNYKEIKIACWWMSVDFRYTRTTFSEMFKFKKSAKAKWGLVKAYLKGYCRNFKMMTIYLRRSLQESFICISHTMHNIFYIPRAFLVCFLCLITLIWNW